jgi:hypothetical protein
MLSRLADHDVFEELAGITAVPPRFGEVCDGVSFFQKETVPMKANLIIGQYTSLRNAIEYEYDATWRNTPAGLIWSATVSVDGRHAARPMGMMHGAVAAAEDSAVREAIKRAIEALASE